MALVLKNRYKYDDSDVLGKGGFGTVYKGYDMLNDNDVAIKVDTDMKYNRREKFSLRTNFLANMRCKAFCDEFDVTIRGHYTSW